MLESQTGAARRVAITIDDLPVVSRNFTSAADHERITSKLVGAVVRHRVPAIGFVNEGKLDLGGATDEREVDLLRQWARAGLELGNHTYSHADLHVVVADAYLADIARGDEVTRRVKRRRYAFARLDEVLSDSAYRSADSYIGPAGITWLHRWALTRGRRGQTFAGEPEVPPDIARSGR